MRKIYIAGRQEAVTRIAVDSMTKKATVQDYQSVVSASVPASTRINCLAVVVRVMEQLSEKDMSKDTEPTVIFTVGMVSDAIMRGTFKYWLTKGTNSKGDDITDTEMKLWGEFTELYMKLYKNIIIKNIASCAIPEHTRFAVSPEQRIDAEYAKKAWDRVKETVPEIEEEDSEAI